MFGEKREEKREEAALAEAQAQAEAAVEDSETDDASFEPDERVEGGVRAGQRRRASVASPDCGPPVRRLQIAAERIARPASGWSRQVPELVEGPGS
jgi:hypothetical protein